MMYSATFTTLMIRLWAAFSSLVLSRAAFTSLFTSLMITMPMTRISTAGMRLAVRAVAAVASSISNQLIIQIAPFLKFVQEYYTKDSAV